MPISAFSAAINQIVDEKGIAKEKVLETIEAAVAAAYRREYGKPSQIIKVSFDEKDSQFQPSQVFEVVASDEEIEDIQRQKTLDQAKEINKKVKVGEEISIPLEVHSDFGRIAAQTAKQVIIQRLREAERDVIFEEFREKQNTLLVGSVQQLEGENVIISLGKANAIMSAKEQIPNENYRIGQRLRVYIKEVNQSNRGPQIIVSRADSELIRQLFCIEVPEIPNGLVDIKSIAREPGSRTKIAVSSNQSSIDPVGSCVGQRGTRVQAVLNEIGDEKIDIILWNEELNQFIQNSLSPAKIETVEIITKGRAKVFVDEDQLSLAIGKNGQNVRLASKLTGFMIDIEEVKNRQPAISLAKEIMKPEQKATKKASSKSQKAIKIKTKKASKKKKTEKTND